MVFFIGAWKLFFLCEVSPQIIKIVRNKEVQNGVDNFYFYTLIFRMILECGALV